MECDCTDILLDWTVIGLECDWTGLLIDWSVFRQAY